MDVRQPQTIAAAVDEALKEFQRIDILINGEGAVGRGRVWAHCWEGCSAQASLGAQRKQSSVCGTIAGVRIIPAALVLAVPPVYPLSVLSPRALQCADIIPHPACHRRALTSLPALS